MKKIVQFGPLNNLSKAFLTLILALTLLWAPEAHAESARARFLKYINLRFYEKALFHAAAAEAMKEVTCAQPGTRVARTKMKVLSKVRFTKKRAHPAEGIWREETHVILCGKSVDVNVMVVARPNSEPVFLAKED